MASITIRNLDDNVKARLRVRAAENGRSMEEEVRRLLAMAIDHIAVCAVAETAGQEGEQDNLAMAIRRRFEPLRGVELELAPRGPLREPPRFD